MAEFSPSKLLRGVSEANGLSAWPTAGKCKFVSAMTSQVNHSAPAHLDDDFLSSMHQLNVEGASESNDAVQCMCFPTHRFAMGLSLSFFASEMLQSLGSGDPASEQGVMRG